MSYYLCRIFCGREEVTACYDTLDQVKRFAKIQAEKWRPKSNGWYVKKADRFDSPGEKILTLTGE